MSGLKFQKKKRRKKDVPSGQHSRKPKGRCYLCSRCGQTQEHHIFGGPNRTLSEKYGLKVYLCLECHATGKHAVHRDKAVMDELHRQGQEAFEEQLGSRKVFMQIFGRNYL